MKIISFNGYEFNPRNIMGKVECPENIMSKMVKTVLDNAPKDVDVKEYAQTTSVSRGAKKVVVSVWQFNLSDWEGGKPFNYFYKDGSDKVIVWGLQFYENGKFMSNINNNANIRCAMGYPIAEERKALFMLGTKAMMYVRTMSYDIELFFSDVDSRVALISSKLPAGSKIDSDKLYVGAKVPVKDYIVNITYRNGVLAAEIPHKYTDTDLAYGAQYSNYTRYVKLPDDESVEQFDWDALWEDLYENRSGTCTYRGSLGT